jgi:hypothetical protein
MRLRHVDVAETYVTAELFDQVMARLARKRVPVLESTPEPVVEHVVMRLERRCDVPMVLDNPLGTGVGQGVLADGRSLRHATNGAGEWGRAVLVPGDREATMARLAEAVRSPR